MVDFDAELGRVERLLKHRFGARSLLCEALTHRSFANEAARGLRDNERLEFLGDAVIDAVVAEALWRNFPNATEGELSRRRSELVCAAALAALAEPLGIGRALRLGKGELRTGGRRKSKLLAGAFEACIGAVFLDGGLAAATLACVACYGERLLAPFAGLQDPKSTFQERLQEKTGQTPTYRTDSVTGPNHRRLYRVSACVGFRTVGVGAGSSRVSAEQAAARAALAAMFGANQGVSQASRPDIDDPTENARRPTAAVSASSVACSAQSFDSGAPDVRWRRTPR